MHLVINAAHSRGVGVVALGGEDHLAHELGVAKQSPDTLDNIAIMELQMFTSKSEVLALERW
jgi:hypothetical protein